MRPWDKDHHHHMSQMQGQGHTRIIWRRCGGRGDSIYSKVYLKLVSWLNWKEESFFIIALKKINNFSLFKSRANSNNWIWIDFTSTNPATPTPPFTLSSASPQKPPRPNKLYGCFIRCMSDEWTIVWRPTPRPLPPPIPWIVVQHLTISIRTPLSSLCLLSLSM